MKKTSESRCVKFPIRHHKRTRQMCVRNTTAIVRYCTNQKGTLYSRSGVLSRRYSKTHDHPPESKIFTWSPQLLLQYYLGHSDQRASIPVSNLCSPKYIFRKTLTVFTTINHSSNSDQTCPQHDATTTMLHHGDGALEVIGLCHM